MYCHASGKTYYQSQKQQSAMFNISFQDNHYLSLGCFVFAVQKQFLFLQDNILVSIELSRLDHFPKGTIIHVLEGQSETGAHT